MSAQAKRVLNAWIKDYLPKDMPFGDVQRLAKAAQLSPGTLRQIRNRGSVSAETILSVMLARGVSEDDLINIKPSAEVKFSKSLTEWNRLGSSISEKQREQLLKLVHFLLSDWTLK
ncbi:MAG: hypothetical protein KF865_11310 [Bdellovibrionaceae bacterium]|nr:hypothetical protein [Pseudobdellovibrionaceae bacterium]